MTNVGLFLQCSMFYIHLVTLKKKKDFCLFLFILLRSYASFFNALLVCFDAFLLFLLLLPHKHSTLNKMYFVNIYTQESVCLKWFLEEVVHKYNLAFIWKI